MRFKAKDEECPRCGWSAKRTGSFECPFCGELIAVDFEECPFCGADLSKMSPKARAQSIEKIRGTLMADLADFESSDEGNQEGKYCCPKCTALLDGLEAKCPRCGQVLIGKAGLKCPTCGAPVGKRKKSCPVCGSSISDAVKTARRMVLVFPGLEPLSADTHILEPESLRSCPICGAVVPTDIRRCPICDADFFEQVESPESRPMPVGEPEKPPIRESIPIPEAGAAEAALAAEASSQSASQTPEQTPGPPSDAKAQFRTPPPKRTPRTEVVTTVDRGAKADSRGFSNGVSRTNGHGRVNGTGKTNGMGAVNGKAFVNGTGISNGLGPRSRDTRGRRNKVLSRWQILAILIAIVVLIPAFMFLSYSNPKSAYSIDGDFSEWSEIVPYGTKMYSASATTNITGWAVATDASDLFLYFTTQERMMSTPDAESFYLFVDADGSNDTGYLLGSIGAEYMLRLTGWDDKVNSSSMSRYSSADRLDWNAWTSMGSLSQRLDGTRIEVKGSLDSTLGNSAKFVILSKDSSESGCISYAAPMNGPVLIIRQTPSQDVSLDGVIEKSSTVEVLTIRFTSEGGSGEVSKVAPSISGATMNGQIPFIKLSEGESQDVTISLDTVDALAGSLVTAEIFVSGVTSTYASVEVCGSGASAYVSSPPSTISIDGAFADWTLLSSDVDSMPVTVPSVDIDEVGNSSDSQSSYFYVSVRGEMCSGSYVPTAVAKPMGSGGGAVIPSRRTGEDVLRVFVDGDGSASTGQEVATESKNIGADRMVEIKGLFGRITSTKEFAYSSGGWVEMTDEVQAAKDEHRMEIGISASSLGDSTNVNFIIETTSWRGRGDIATFDASTVVASTKAWVVDPITTSAYSTSMSYQRKMFYDGVNYWSFYFNGLNTVCKYSVDGGRTWVLSGRVFTTARVNETSIWYDPAAKTVYAVGDAALPSRNVSVQMGFVDAASHRITWAAVDTDLTTSLNPIGGKNTYISKDSNGYLWVLSTNWTQIKPLQHDMSAFKSKVANSTGSWTNTGEIMPFGMYENNSKGSIVPAGVGSDMWAIYTYEGYVCAKKYQNGAWPADYDERIIYKADNNWANTENSPPSVVVDGKGVVHVVYGTGRQDKFSKVSIPQIFYSRNNTNSMTFTPGLNLDPSNDTRAIANYYPTISLDISTDNLYVFWLQCDSTFNARTVMGKKCAAGSWSFMSFTQSTYTKQFMTSVYSVAGETHICWQWTQNSTLPIQVMFDKIPEFSDLILPTFGLVMIFAVMWNRRRNRDEHLS